MLQLTDIVERKVIYIAGPLSTNGEWLTNIHIAADVAATLIDAGFAPICPHLLALGQIVRPVANDHDYTTWMNVDCSIINVCHGVLRLPGESFGADFEVRYAQDNDIPVFFELEELEDYFNDFMER